MALEHPCRAQGPTWKPLELLPWFRQRLLKERTEVFVVSTDPVTSKDLISRGPSLRPPSANTLEPNISISCSDEAGGAQWPPGTAAHLHAKGEVSKESKPEEMRKHPEQRETDTLGGVGGNSNAGEKRGRQ